MQTDEAKRVIKIHACIGNECVLNFVFSTNYYCWKTDTISEVNHVWISTRGRILIKTFFNFLKNNFEHGNLRSKLQENVCCLLKIGVNAIWILFTWYLQKTGLHTIICCLLKIALLSLDLFWILCNNLLSTVDSNSCKCCNQSRWPCLQTI